MTPPQDAARRPILVLGATGKTGRRVLKRLQDQGVAARAGSRTADPPFDWEDRSTWEPVLEGVRASLKFWAKRPAQPATADTPNRTEDTAHRPPRQAIRASATS